MNGPIRRIHLFEGSPTERLRDGYQPNGAGRDLLTVCGKWQSEHPPRLFTNERGAVCPHCTSKRAHDERIAAAPEARL